MSYIRMTVIGMILASFLGLGFYTYNVVKNKGFQEATAICEQNFKKYEEERDARIAEVEAASRILVAENQKKADRLTKKMTETIKQLKEKPLVVIKENKCELTETFSSSFAKINQTANQSMKDNQK